MTFSYGDYIPPISIDASHLVHDEVVNDDLNTFSNDQSEEECTSIDFDSE